MADEQTDPRKFTVRVRRSNGWYPIVGKILEIFSGWGKGEGSVIDPMNDTKEGSTERYDAYVPQNENDSNLRGAYFLDSTGHWFPSRLYLVWNEADEPDSSDGIISWLVWNEAKL